MQYPYSSGGLITYVYMEFGNLTIFFMDKQLIAMTVEVSDRQLKNWLAKLQRLQCDIDNGRKVMDGWHTVMVNKMAWFIYSICIKCNP